MRVSAASQIPTEVSQDLRTDLEPDWAVGRGQSARLLVRAKAPVIVAAFALPLVLYFVLRPENYGLTPNSLDPIFYTGYGINFDDMINAIGDRHYFVSRWSAYMPGYIADAIAGPFVGRLLLRLVLAAGILWSLWALGRQWRWTFAQRCLVGTLVLTMPMFVRAFFTDYVEYLVVALGICLVCVCLRENQSAASAITIGTLGGLIVVANPVAVTTVGLCVLTSLVVGARTWRARAMVASVVAGSASAVVVGGVVLFRWRYGIHNVYQPSIDFIRSYHVTDDPWRSPRLEWLAKFTWLFAVPILLLSALAFAWRRQVRFDRVEKGALVLCAVQYATHWFDQFVRRGLSLEVSFYWSFAYPTFAVAVALVVGRLTASARASTLGMLTVGWVAFLLVGVPNSLRLPSGVLFGLLAVGVVAGAASIAHKLPLVAIAAVVLLIGWTQIGAPAYDPSSYTPINASPQYDQLFRKADDLSETVYRETVWFEEQMDRIVNDASAAFVTGSGFSRAVVAIYAPHVINRLLEVEPGGSHLTPIAISEIKMGTRPIVAVYGPPSEVAGIVETFAADLGVETELLDETDGGGLGYRLVVYAMPDSARLPFVFEPGVLAVANGKLVDSSVTVAAGDGGGFVTYGPYATLQPGSYRVTLHYSSAAPKGEDVGVFDVFPVPDGSEGNTAIDGTAGADGEVSMTFDVADSTTRWEFRSSWNGVGSLTINDVTLDHA